MNKQDWINKTKTWKQKWNIFDEQKTLNDDSNGINIYRFIQELNKNLKEDSVVVSCAGSSYYCVPQAIKLTPPQKWITSLSQAELGSGIGIAIGISFARNKGEVIQIVGDGSLLTNLSAMATIKRYNLPIKIFVLNNQGYLTNLNTQKKFYNNRKIGVDYETGLFFPNFYDLANTFKIGYLKIREISNLDGVIKQAMKLTEPCIIEIVCPKWQEVIPTADATKDEGGKLVPLPLSQMYPQLSREEIDAETINDL